MHADFNHMFYYADIDTMLDNKMGIPIVIAVQIKTILIPDKSQSKLKSTEAPWCNGQVVRHLFVSF